MYYLVVWLLSKMSHINYLGYLLLRLVHKVFEQMGGSRKLWPLLEFYSFIRIDFHTALMIPMEV